MSLEITNKSLLHFFSTLHIDLNELWLKDVVGLLKSQFVNINIKQYKNLIFHQLLYSNLSNSLNVKKSYNLTNDKKFNQEKVNLFVQIKNIYDISRPAFDQYLDMSFDTCLSIGDFDLQYKNTEEDSNDKVNKCSTRRMLMLNVTDGKNDFIAIESEYISFLSEYFRPGIKMYIFGECQIANGIIHLTTKNCQVVGGEVDSYLSQNTLEIVLLKLLANNKITDKDKKQAKKFCVDKMKTVDRIFNEGYINNPLDSSNPSNDLPKQPISENSIINKENTDTSANSIVNSFNLSNNDDPVRRSSLVSVEKTCSCNKIIDLKTSISQNNSGKKARSLTVSEIFDYFFKLQILLNDNWISSIINEVNSKYMDQKSRIEHIYDLFLKSDIDQCLISSSPEFKKGKQQLEASLLMEIESISLRKRKNSENVGDLLESRFLYKLNDGTKSFPATIKGLSSSDLCDRIHLMPGFKIMIHRELEVDDNNYLSLNSFNCKILDKSFVLPDFQSNDGETKTDTKLSKPPLYIVIDSDEEFVMEDNVPNKKQKLC